MIKPKNIKEIKKKTINDIFKFLWVLKIKIYQIFYNSLNFSNFEKLLKNLGTLLYLLDTNLDLKYYYSRNNLTPLLEFN